MTHNKYDIEQDLKHQYTELRNLSRKLISIEPIDYDYLDDIRERLDKIHEKLILIQSI